MWHSRERTMPDCSSLDPCVHCGFCLPACPTYLVTGDEGHSPRGRIVLMRALERGEIGADDAALANHLDACLGCRGCEPACPSGVGYGRGLEAAREQLFHSRGLGPGARLVLGVFRYRLVDASYRPAPTARRPESASLRDGHAGSLERDDREDGADRSVLCVFS